MSVANTTGCVRHLKALCHDIMLPYLVPVSLEIDGACG